VGGEKLIAIGRTFAGVAALSALTLSACVTEEVLRPGERPRSSYVEPEERPPATEFVAPSPSPSPSPYAAADATRAPIFPPGLLPPSPPAQGSGSNALSPYHRFSHQTIHAKDGRLTRLIYVRSTFGAKYVTLIPEHTSVAEDDISIVTDMLVDPRKNASFPKGSTLEALLPGVDKVADLILVTGTESQLMEVDQLMSALLIETPQIEIEAKVVEVSFDDDVEFGANITASETKINHSGKQVIGNQKSTLFTQFTSPLDPDAFLSGQQVGTLALAFFTDDMKFRAFFRAIQNSKSSDVLSAPKMAVLNGHRAVIDTGARIPVQTPVLGASGQLTQVQVKFEETGVRLIVTPYLLMDDMIQIDVVADVSFVSSFVESGATGILNPVISQRTASTVVNVRDGQTFGIGGLISTDQIELVTKIPILGDIPFLGWLFKTKSITEQQSQVIFFITPRILRPSTPLFDPGV